MEIGRTYYTLGLNDRCDTVIVEVTLRHLDLVDGGEYDCIVEEDGDGFGYPCAVRAKLADLFESRRALLASTEICSICGGRGYDGMTASCLTCGSRREDYAADAVTQMMEREQRSLERVEKLCRDD